MMLLVRLVQDQTCAVSPRNKGFQVVGMGLVTLLVGSIAIAQQPYPKGYFQFPYKPGTKASLTGNMGELRSNHFHGGLDVRTNYVSGNPIQAAADGYVSFIQYDTHGYGNMLTITHPNGLKTVYAHLQEFSPVIQDYVRAKQYELETFKVELTPPMGMFKFKKGDTIGLGGNTGHSGGPHLHFEIRDSLDGIFNPLIVGFPEVVDKMAPYFVRLAVKPLDIHARIGGEHKRMEVGIKKLSEHKYLAEKPVEVWGTFGIEAQVLDRINNGSHRASINCLEMNLDGKEIYYHNLSHLSLAEQKQINNHLAYDAYVRTGTKFQKCYVADGNLLANFRTAGKLGRISILDENRHTLTIHISDPAGNSADLTMTLVGKRPVVPSAAATDGAAKARFRHEMEENILKIWASHLPESTKSLTVHTRGITHTLPLAYNDEGRGLFLWDMRRGLPDSVTAANGSEAFHFKAVFPSGKNSDYKGQYLDIQSADDALYDTLYLEVKEDLEEKWVQISHGHTPLHTPINLVMKPFAPVAMPEKTGAAQIISKERLKFAGGRWTPEGTLKVRTKYLGKYTFVEDTKPPTIRKVVVNPNSIRFQIGDNMAGVHSWRATLDGKWLLFCYEHKTNVIWAEPRTKGTRMTGRLVLEVKDGLGNVARWEGDVN